MRASPPLRWPTALVFVADNAFTIHCLDADSGHCYWTHSARKGATCFSSPPVADGKVYLGKTILSASKRFELRDGIKNDQNTAYSSHCVANGVVFAVIGDRLWAICNKADKKRGDAVESPAATGPTITPWSRAGHVRTAQPGRCHARGVERRNQEKLAESARAVRPGHCTYHVTPPIDFDATTGKNVRWKTPIPKAGRKLAGRMGRASVLDRRR